MCDDPRLLLKLLTESHCAVIVMKGKFVAEGREGWESLWTDEPGVES